MKKGKTASKQSEAKKEAAKQKKLIEEQKRKEFAEKVLKDLDEI